MKRNLFFTILAGIILFAACNKEELGELPISEHTIYATLPSDDAQTRTTINDNLQVVWGENDQISVFAVNGDEFTNNQGVISGGVGTTDATFSVTVDGTEKVAAVYPYFSTTSFDGETITITMDNEYQYSENGICGAPMAAIINSQDAIIAFKNAGALMGLTVNNIPAGYNQAILESTGEEVITGVCEIIFDANGNPTLTPRTEAEGGKTITINFEASASLTSKTFYFPIPVQEYGGLKLSISNGTETIVLKQKALNAERSVRYKSTLTLDEVSGSTPVDASSASEATEKLSDGNSSVNVTITENETQPTIYLPTSDKSTSLSFESIPAGKTVTIQETVGAAVSDNVNISVSSDENSENSFDIQLPNSTVTLNANGEEATYKQVTAHTAANTLIIGNGVTVETLIVKGGNVRVCGTGTIKAISRTDDNADVQTIIFLEEGAVIPSSLDEKILKIEGDEDKWNGESYYAPSYDEATKTYSIKNAYELAWVAVTVNGGNNLAESTIILENDIDLNNKQWTSIGTESTPFKGTLNGNNKIIKNLKIIETEAKEGKAYIGLFGYAKDVTIKDVTFENVNLNIACLDIDHSQGHIGAVAGSLEGTSTIENVTVKGDIFVESTITANGASRVAVVAGGNAYGNVTMKNVHVTANEGSYLKANNNVGALAGQLQGKSVFNNCSSNIDVTGTKFFAGGIIGLAAGDQTFENCHTTGDITITAGREGRAHDQYRVGGIAGGWADGAKNVCTLTNCSYTGTISGTNADGSIADPLDYAGYVGRGYNLNGCQGSTVTIDGVSYVQAFDEAANSGVYYINDELIINSAANLKVLATKVNSGNDFAGKTVKLTNDIDLKNEEWTPIGNTMSMTFSGNFNGQNHKIKNLKITDKTTAATEDAYLGLFGVTAGSESSKNTIKNLVIENVNILSAGQIVSAAIAYPYYTIVENITVQGDISITGGNYTAGILAYTRRCYDAKNLTINGNSGSTITGANTVGGVISDIQSNGGAVTYSDFSASGLTISANANVGGISGIISAQTLDGATVNNVVISCAEGNKTIGIVSGALGSTSIVKNISYSAVTGATNVIGAQYESGDPAYCHGPYEDNEYYLVPEVTVSGDVDAMNAALNTGAYIKMDGRLLPSSAFVHDHKSIIDGQNNYIWGGTFYSINTSGGTIKNLEFWQAQKAINIVGQKSKVILNNVKVVSNYNCNYAIHADEGNGDGLEATNCKFYALISYAAGLGDVKFTSCTFGANKSGNKGINAYASTEFVGCAFEEGCTVYLSDNGSTVTFENCTYKGVAITTDNLSEVVTGNIQNASVK